MRTVVMAWPWCLAVALGLLFAIYAAVALGQDNAPALATVSIRQVAAVLGSVEVPVSLDSHGALVRSAHVNFAYDPDGLDLKRAKAVHLPESWLISYHSPAPGELRVVAYATDGQGAAFSGPIMQLEGSVLAVATSPIGVSLADIRDADNQAVAVTIYGGGASPRRGDLDCDGQVNVADVVLLMRYLVDLAPLEDC